MEGDGTIKSPSGPWQFRKKVCYLIISLHGWWPGEQTVLGVKNLSFKFLFSASQLPLLSN